MYMGTPTQGASSTDAERQQHRRGHVHPWAYCVSGGGPAKHLPPSSPPASSRDAPCVYGEGRIRATWGWISVDRGSKATLPLTMPRRVFKSSAKDSARRPCEIDLQGGRPRLVRRGGLADGTGPSGQMPLLWVGRDGGRWRRLLAWILT
ncbi:hypothetical protein FCM35_KLT21715 [Carex littledalei]|uniref:Uncharacterized protein n=2 Tax=Carex littledalei TaxID=544730 RepID=A0A833VDP6_9POAL|nr:hypothetical protein FCM35_KLT21715 [Carex littledalei]